MKKTILFVLLAVAVLLLVGCGKTEEAATPEAEAAEADEQLLAGEGGAVAGQAVNVGCRAANVLKCADVQDGVKVTAKIKLGKQKVAERTYTYKNSCGSQAIKYSCVSPTRYQRCKQTCEAGEECQSGLCVALPAAEEAPQFGCTDTDGGINIWQAGSAADSVIWGDVPAEDRCEVDGSLTEFHCRNLAQQAPSVRGGSISFQCANGCVAGACVQDPIPADGSACNTTESLNIVGGERGNYTWTYDLPNEQSKLSAGQAPARRGCMPLHPVGAQYTFCVDYYEDGRLADVSEESIWGGGRYYCDNSENLHDCAYLPAGTTVNPSFGAPYTCRHREDGLAYWE